MLGATRANGIPTVKHRVISRKRVGGLLSYSLTKPLTVISAPAGYGKTLAVLSQLPRLNHFECVWLNITQRMNDAQQLVDALCNALTEQLLESSVCQALRAQLLTQEGHTPMHRLQSLFDVIEANCSDCDKERANVLLVLDDYHHIEENTVHELLNYLVDELPIYIRVLLIARNRPPLAERYLNSSSECTYLSQEHLQFDLDESVDFVQNVIHVNLERDQIQLIHQQAQGWPLGIQLIAIQWQLSKSMQNGALDDGDFAGVTAHLFENHVLSQLSLELRQVMVELAHLQSFSADLVSYIYGNEMGNRVINTIEQENLFYSRSGIGNTSYRFHDLFKEFLIAKTSGGAIAIFEQAAQWFLQKNDFHLAIHYLLKGQEFDQAAKVIGHYGDQLYRRGEIHTLKTWLDALPSEVKEAYPGLLILSCWTIADVEKPALCPIILDQLDRYFTKEEARPGFTETNQWRQLKVDHSLIKAFIDLICVDFDESIECTTPAIDQIQRFSLAGAGRAYLLLGQNRYFLGEHGQAMLDTERAIHLAKQEKNPYVMIVGVAYLFFLYPIAGKIDEFLQAGHEVMTWLEENGFKDLPMAKIVLFFLADIYREKNELDKSFELLGEGLSYFQGDIPIFQQIALQLTYLRYLFSIGEYEKAIAVVERVKELTPRVLFKGKKSLWTFAQPSADTLRCAVLIAQGKVEETRYILSQLKEQFIGEEEFIWESERVLLARLLLSVGDTQGALQIAASVKSNAVAGKRLLHELQCQLIEAVAWYSQGREEEAMDQFLEALERGLHCNYRRLFLDNEKMLAPLLEQAQNQPRAKACVELLWQSKTESNSTKERGDAQLKLSSLTRREMAVISLLAEGDSNKKIAQKLNIAPETAKKFVNNILKKLQMRNRTEAALFYNNSH